MKKLVVYGHSDDVGMYDIKQIDGIVGDNIVMADEFYPPSYLQVTWSVDTVDYGFNVHLRYSPSGTGCWSVGVEPIEEDQPMVDGDQLVGVLVTEGYSAQFTTEIPDDAKVKIKR